MNRFWKPKDDHRLTQSKRWSMSLPVTPLGQHLASLHAICVHLGAQGDALLMVEHHLREIALFTVEQPGDSPRGPGLRYPREQYGWKSPSMTEENARAAALIQPFIADQLRRNNDVVEEMCERMLTQDGTDYGVLVIQKKDGSVEASLSPKVEFGQIGYQWEGTQ